MPPRCWGPLAVALGITLVVVGVMGGATASASGGVRSHKSLVLRPQFRRVVDADWIWAGARYALAGPAPAAEDQSVTLIDDQTGRRTTLTRAGCQPGQPSSSEPLDLPWVPFNCGTSTNPVPELYSPSTGQWRAVSPSPSLTGPCAPYACDVQYSLVAAGTYWLEYTQSICPMGAHCSSSNMFQSISTGELRQDPSGGSTTVDLNTPNLTQSVCGPLSVPTAAQDYGEPGPGALIFYGSFALAIGTDTNVDPEVYLERCGTHMHRLVAKAPYPTGMLYPGANTHEVVWMAHQRFLSALSLPGLRPFTIRLPARLPEAGCAPPAPAYNSCLAQIALTNRRLYLLTPNGQVWAATTGLPKSRQRR